MKFDADWSYMLGVICGDGHVGKRSLQISVGYKDAKYADLLMQLWQKLGFNPKIYRPRSALRIDVHSTVLVQKIAPFKQSGRWHLPRIFCMREYLAGLFDTDGCVAKPELKHISISQSRRCNIVIVKQLLMQLGMREPVIHKGRSNFLGKEYQHYSIRLTGMDRLMVFMREVSLRHPRKARRLNQMQEHVQTLLAKRPLWFMVGTWLHEHGEKTWEEIAEEFHLSKPQFDSMMQHLKSATRVEVIPPPKALSKYRVSDPLSFRGQ